MSDDRAKFAGARVDLSHLIPKDKAKDMRITTEIRMGDIRKWQQESDGIMLISFDGGMAEASILGKLDYRFTSQVIVQLIKEHFADAHARGLFLKELVEMLVKEKTNGPTVGVDAKDARSRRTSKPVASVGKPEIHNPEKCTCDMCNTVNGIFEMLESGDLNEK